jgi:hypothetical protein
MLFIDSDIEFEAKDVISMLHFDKDVIGGMYPLKSIEWDYVKEAVLKNPNIDPTDLAYQGVRWSGHPFKGNLNMASEEPIEVEELATGFLMIKRGVFKALDAISPTYTPAVDDKVAKGKPVKDYFEVGVVNDRYESEDYSFCRKYRETGGKIYMCPWINLVHHGSHPFKGNLVKVAQGLGTIN